MSEPSDQWLDANRAWWDERAPLHVGSEFYGLEEFIADPTASRLRAFEPGELGDVAGRTLVHPQCHFGMDTLSWARRGVRVTGIDFSAPAVAAAADTAARAGLDAEFLAGNVYDAAELVGGRTFDVVYTGLGALNWLPDIPRWAEVMASLTAPGGVLYLVEFHPFQNILGDDDLTVVFPYFQERGLVFDDGQGTYADLGAATDANTTVEWTHGLGEVLSAVLAAGYTIELFHEFDYTLFPRWPFLVERNGIYRLPAEMPSLPLMYSLRARR
jgi:SAM-dependent methyltransferase